MFSSSNQQYIRKQPADKATGNNATPIYCHRDPNLLFACLLTQESLVLFLLQFHGSSRIDIMNLLQNHQIQLYATNFSKKYNMKLSCKYCLIVICPDRKSKYKTKTHKTKYAKPVFKITKDYVQQIVIIINTSGSSHGCPPHI